MSVEVKRLRLGDMMTNCYLVSKDEYVLIIDPGDEPERVMETIRQRNQKPVAILLTHGHFDHTGAVERLRKEYGILVYAHEQEKQVLENPGYSLTQMTGDPYTISADYYMTDGETMNISGMEFQVIHTPGHTPGGCCFYFKAEKMLFSGDTLFCQSRGRTDFPGGSESALIRSIKEKLCILEEDTVVFPGHEEETTIGYEQQWY